MINYYNNVLNLDLITMYYLQFLFSKKNKDQGKQKESFGAQKNLFLCRQNDLQPPLAYICCAAHALVNTSLVFFINQKFTLKKESLETNNFLNKK